MANKPFDQRVINPLERPSSSDLNIAFSQLNATYSEVMRALMARNESFVATKGAIGRGFAPTPMSGLTFALYPGIFLIGDTATSSYEYNIGDIYGVNNTALPRYAYLRGTKALTVPDLPASGTCRRDFVYIRALEGGVEHLSDETLTDIYDPSVQTFAAVSVPKTMTMALDDVAPEYLSYSGGGSITPTAAIVYVRGSEVPYVDEDSYLSSDFDLLPSTYRAVAAVNVKSDTSSITTAHLADYRYQVAPYGEMTLTGKATVGSSGSIPGAALSNVSMNTPPSVRASIYKLGANSATQTNSYVLAVFGPRHLSDATAHVSVGVPEGDDLLTTWTHYPASVMMWAPRLNNVVDAATQVIYADGDKALPVQDVAVGQYAHFFPFTVGRTTTASSPQTVSVSGTNFGKITIEDPPGYPAMYPAGTYPVNSSDITRKFLFAYGDNAEAPIDGLVSPTYKMVAPNVSTSGEWHGIGINDLSYRVAGFVTDPGDVVLESGNLPGFTWTFDFWSTWEVIGGAKVTAAIKLYWYDGINDPEAGSPFAVSSFVPLAIGDVRMDNPSARVPALNTITMLVPTTVVPFPGARILAVLELSTQTTLVSNIFIYFKDKYPFVATTSLATTSSITIPNSTTDYPAGEYLVTGTGTGTITVDVPGQPYFDPANALFARRGIIEESLTLPIRFTVNMTV